MPGYRLIVSARGASGREQTFDFAGDVVRVGRSEDVEVRLPHPNVSQLHLRLERHGGQVYAVDVGSTNGTTIGGETLEPDVARPLRDGEVLVLGAHFELRYAAASPEGAVMTEPRVTAAIAHRLVEELLATGTAGQLADASVGPELVGDAGVAKGKTVRLPAPDSRTVIGRGEGCDVIALDPDLSREHIEVRRTWNGVTVADLGSKNGTRLDGERLADDRPVPLRDGAVVRAGACAWRFVDPAARYLKQLDDLIADEAPEPEPDAPVAGVDRSWAWASGPEAPAVESAPAGRASGPSALPLVILAVVVIGGVAGLIWLFAS